MCRRMNTMSMRNFKTIYYLKWMLLLNVGIFIIALSYRWNTNSLSLKLDHYKEAAIQSAENGGSISNDVPTRILKSKDEHNQEDASADLDEYQFPNIVHYIWYNEQTISIHFHHLLAMKSAHQVLKPDVIYFHTNKEPTGDYWEEAKKIPTLRVNHRDPPTSLFGESIKPPKFYTSHSNVDRVKILQEYGGIYLDLDVFVTKGFDELRRKHPCFIGQELETKACGSVIGCSKDSLFLTLWLNSYLDDYRMDVWAYNTGQVPYNLAKRYPHLVYMEPSRINQPNYKQISKIWSPNDRFDWWDNYSVHIIYRLWKDMSDFYDGVEPCPETIKTMNNSFGEMARFIYYGSSKKIT